MRAAGPAAAGLGHRACLGAVGRAFPPDGDRRRSRSAASGLVDLDHLRALLADGPPALVSVMLANNETGAHPAGRRSRRDRSCRPAACCMSMRSRRLGKFRSISMRWTPICCRFRRTRSAARRASARWCWPTDVQGLEPLLRGGGQELGRRAGTENVAGIAGFRRGRQGCVAASGATVPERRRGEGRHGRAGS